MTDYASLSLQQAIDLLHARDCVIHDKECVIQDKESVIQNKDCEIESNKRLILTKEQEIQANCQQIKTTEALNAYLITENRRLRGLKYRPTTESFNGTQLQLLEAEDRAADIAALETVVEQHDTEPTAPATIAPKVTKSARIGAGRQPLPAHLPRIDIRHDVKQCKCGTCVGDLKFIRDEVTEKLNIKPIEFEVERHIYPQYACKDCETIVSELSIPEVIQGGMPTANTLAWVAIGKYGDHLPLYRLNQIAQRAGVNLSLSTLSSWIGAMGVHLKPLWDRLVELLQAEPILHADETPVLQLANNKGGSKKAYIWAYRTGVHAQSPPIILFDYHASRSGSCVENFLGTWKGVLMTDDYAGYKKLFRQDVVELGCWAHARRKFFEQYEANQSPTSAYALEQIKRIYAIEAKARESNLDGLARYELRQQQAKPILDEYHLWLVDSMRQATPNSGLSKAINYSLKRWDALYRYIENGSYPLDNNPIENAIRPIAVGKKNWLFAGSELAGERAAVIQSLIATAKANGLDPHKWLVETLIKLPTHPNSRIDELLPLANLKPL